MPKVRRSRCQCRSVTEPIHCPKMLVDDHFEYGFSTFWKDLERTDGPYARRFKTVINLQLQIAIQVVMHAIDNYRTYHLSFKGTGLPRKILKFLLFLEIPIRRYLYTLKKLRLREQVLMLCFQCLRNDVTSKYSGNKHLISIVNMTLPSLYQDFAYRIFMHNYPEKKLIAEHFASHFNCPIVLNNLLILCTLIKKKAMIKALIKQGADDLVMAKKMALYNADSQMIGLINHIKADPSKYGYIDIDDKDALFRRYHQSQANRLKWCNPWFTTEELRMFLHRQTVWLQQNSRCYCHLIFNEYGCMWEWGDASIFRVIALLDDELVYQVGIETNPRDKIDMNMINVDTDDDQVIPDNSDSPWTSDDDTD